MADVKTLREQAANIATEARAKLDEAMASTDEARSTELEAQHDDMMADYDKTVARAGKMEKLDKATRDAEQRAENAEREARAAKRPAGAGDVVVDNGVMDYREAFFEMVKSGGDTSAEVRNVLAAGHPEHRAQLAGTDSAGGHFVPTTLAEQIEISMVATGPMYDGNVVTVMNTESGNSFDLPTIDDTGKTAEAHTEGGAVTDDGGKDVVIGKKTVGAYSFDTEWLRWSRELAQDSIHNMEPLLGGLLGERLGRLANSKLTIGSGSSDVEGIATAAGTGLTAVSATAIAFEEIMELEHSVNSAYRRGPKVGFMMNDATLLAIRKLKDGDGNFLWQQGNVAAGIPNTISGRPYWINDDMAGIATGNTSMLFGDFSKYYTRKVQSPLLMVAKERFAPDYGILGYMRIDGVLTNAAAVKGLVQA